MLSSFFFTSFCITLIHPILLISFLYYCFLRSFLPFLPSSCDYRCFYFPLHFFSLVNLFFLFDSYFPPVCSSTPLYHSPVFFTLLSSSLLFFFCFCFCCIIAASVSALAAEEEEYLKNIVDNSKLHNFCPSYIIPFSIKRRL